MKIGHVHLKVRDLARSVDFYRGVLGMKVTETVPGITFLSAGPMHHEVALQELGPDAPNPSRYSVGLYHSAFEVESDEELRQLASELRSRGVDYSAVDHGISHAVYFSDPDGNGLEVYVDMRGRPEGKPSWGGVSHRLDL